MKQFRWLTLTSIQPIKLLYLDFLWSFSLRGKRASRRRRGTFRFTLPKIKLWWHLSKKEYSTPESLTKVELVVKISSMWKCFSCVCWNVNSRCLYPGFNANPAGNYMFKVNNRNTGTRCEICSKLTIKIKVKVNVSLLLTLNIFHTWF